MMHVEFLHGFKWSDGHDIHRFGAGPASVPAACGKLAIEQGAATLVEPPKPARRRKAAPTAPTPLPATADQTSDDNEETT